jgi:hypothetical protein
MAEQLPDIYKTSSSIIDMGKILNLTNHDGDQDLYQLPRNEEQLRLWGISGTRSGQPTSADSLMGLEQSQITLFSPITSTICSYPECCLRILFLRPAYEDKKREFKLGGGLGWKLPSMEMKRSIS